MGKILEISFLVITFVITSVDAAIVELPLSCEGQYIPGQWWETEFDLGIAFTEISHVYIDWSVEMTAALAILYDGGGSAIPIDVGMYASLGANPYVRRATLSGGEATYPEPQVFDLRSEFERIGGSSWSDLLDGQGRIRIVSTNMMIDGYYVDNGYIVLNEATMVVEGTPVPEPATVILLALGSLGIYVGRRKRPKQVYFQFITISRCFFLFCSNSFI